MAPQSSTTEVIHLVEDQNTNQTEQDLRLRKQSVTNGEDQRQNVTTEEEDKDALASSSTRDETKPYQMTIVWPNVVKFAILHLIFFYSFFCLTSVSYKTLLFTFACYVYGGLGITAGAHRLWTHRSYKARLPLRIFLAIGNCLAMENSIYIWSRDHRVHHKYSETDADPHNATRGFFFAHIGWLLVRKHPDVITKGAKLDMSDLKNEKLVMFQDKYYIPMALSICIFIPTLIPWYFWGESLWLSYVMAVFRYCFILNATWLVNSAAHMWGGHPYDVNISPAENRFVSFFSQGEGFHNYHHTFPHDYSTSEWRYSLNFTTLFIDLMAWCGQVYDRRSIPREVVEARMARTGSGAIKH
uniref:Delta9 desaturase n=2 Tax=Podoplea TaxID=116571 RepID=A0A1L3THU1_PARNA|nr:delta9-desaturase [Tigriopus japonicus]APH81339.1 delta9 desaturase [Paracyclopina nana]